MKAKELYEYTKRAGCTLFIGVPDSLLNSFMKDLRKNDEEVIIATHESLAMGIAVGATMAGRSVCVFLQNSGVGNLINPITSLCRPYEIYPLVAIGHRHTLPQHRVMAQLDDKLMQQVGYLNYVIVEED